MHRDPPPHLLLVTATTGYQARAFAAAAGRLGVRLTLATDRCHRLDDPWGDHAVPVRFESPSQSLAAVLERHREAPIHALLACGDRAALLAAHLAHRLGLPGNPISAVAACHDKFAFRTCQAEAGLPAPWFRRLSLRAEPRRLASETVYPCVLKPLLLSGSRGVIRADSPAGFQSAFERLATLLQSDEIQQLGDANAGFLQVEQYLPGRELALEGLLENGSLIPLALFDKPDPLEGPFFEETLYVTPSRQPRALQKRITDAVAAAAQALGLHSGPVHAEVRCTPSGVVVLELAARPIGGLCARSLRFVRDREEESISLEELLIRAALGASIRAEGWRREAGAAGVMMIPVPAAGIFQAVDGVDEAAAVEHVEAVEITARPGDHLVPLPEGCSYPGFLFARAATPAQVEAALRAAHARLRFSIAGPLPILA